MEIETEKLKSILIIILNFLFNGEFIYEIKKEIYKEYVRYSLI